MHCLALVDPGKLKTSRISGKELSLKLRLLGMLFIFGACLAAAPPDIPEQIVQNYCVAIKDQEHLAHDASMDVQIEAALPKLKKYGRLHALRHISALGRVTYERLFFEGDGTVKNQVIARYLAAEVEAQKDQSPSLAVTPENYKFKYRGQSELQGRSSYVFQVTPKKKRVGLFKGEVWIDATTYLRVREEGYLVKNPSIFLKKVAFVRRYEIRDGISVPLQVQSVVDTRLVGKAELTIDFSNFSVDAPTQASTAFGEGQ